MGLRPTRTTTPIDIYIFYVDTHRHTHIHRRKESSPIYHIVLYDIYIYIYSSTGPPPTSSAKILTPSQSGTENNKGVDENKKGVDEVSHHGRVYHTVCTGQFPLSLFFFPSFLCVEKKGLGAVHELSLSVSLSLLSLSLSPLSLSHLSLSPTPTPHIQRRLRLLQVCRTHTRNTQNL